MAVERQKFDKQAWVENFQIIQILAKVEHFILDVDWRLAMTKLVVCIAFIISRHSFDLFRENDVETQNFLIKFRKLFWIKCHLNAWNF